MTQINPVRPELRRPQLDAAFLKKALRVWGVSEVIDSTCDLGGAYNANWHVITSDADVVVRVRPDWIRAERLKDVHRLMARLHEREILTAEPRKTPKDETYSEIDGRIVELYDYLPEEGNRHWSAERWCAGFAHMGRLHAALSDVRDEIAPPLVSNYATPSLAIMMLENTRTCLADLPVSRNTREALAITEEAQRITNVIAEFWREIQPQLPYQIVHGDFHLDNLLFDREDRVRYILDFDFMAWRERLYEIAYALRLALPQLTDNTDGILDMVLIKSWLDAYNAHAAEPITEIERRALPYQLAQVLLFYVGRSCTRKNPLWAVLRETAYVELARFLVAQPDTLLNL